MARATAYLPGALGRGAAYAVTHRRGLVPYLYVAPSIALFFLLAEGELLISWLDDVSPLTIARTLDRPVVLVDSLGDVLDAFTGRSRLVFDPAAPERAPQPMRDGGWSVEKYL